ncbi:MAG: L-threonylcarbamoyladenylate synthase [Deltaproteobacteria bacterium]|nr:L-threonylcarbamoyladenylate synthase [Deltaproteobacteria bacterium]
MPHCAKEDRASANQGDEGSPRLWHWGESVQPLQQALGAGEVIALPTESSYALSADPCNPSGVAEVFTIKGRPAGKALPVMVAHRDHLELLGIDAPLAVLEALWAVWPAPLTALLPLRKTLPAAAGLGTLAVRVPAHDRLRRLLEELGPVTATSANRSGQGPLLEVAEVATLVAGRCWLVDDGKLPGGPPSTLVSWEGEAWNVLRRGAFPLERLPIPERDSLGH